MSVFSRHKEFHVLTNYEHGTDLLSDEGVSSMMSDSTEEQIQKRRRLVDDLLRFVSSAFGENIATAGSSETITSTPIPPVDANNPAESNHVSTAIRIAMAQRYSAPVLLFSVKRDNGREITPGINAINDLTWMVFFVLDDV